MAKKMICKSAPEIEISIEGGESKILRFDVACLAELQELYKGGMTEVFKLTISEQAAAITYAAGKNHNDNFTLEDAQKMIAFMDIASVQEIINTFAESVGSSVDSEIAKKIIAQMLRSQK